MIREEVKSLKTGRSELRKFGLLVGGVFAVLGVLMWLRAKPHFAYPLLPGAALLLLGLAAPRTLKPIYVVWMSLAIVLGLIVSNVILVLFFFLVITPIGLVARLAGKDFLRLKPDSQAGSHWIRRETTVKSRLDYEKQF